MVNLGIVAPVTGISGVRKIEFFANFAMILVLIACSPADAGHLTEHSVDQKQVTGIVSTAPRSTPCVTSAAELCPEKYTEIQNSERKNLASEYRKLSHDNEDFCDYLQDELLRFKPFRKELIPPGPNSIALRGKIPGKPPYLAVLASGEVAEVELDNHSFFFARDIAVTPEDNPDLLGFTGYYVGFYENYADFENMSWREFLWFGEFELDKNSAAKNPWIAKMMRTLYHLHQGGFADIERRQSIPKIDWPDTWFNDDIGQMYGIPPPVTGSKYQEFSFKGFDHVDLDSNIFESQPKGQSLEKLDIKVTDDALYLMTYSPRRVVAKITENRPIAQYQICQK